MIHSGCPDYLCQLRYVFYHSDLRDSESGVHLSDIYAWRMVFYICYPGAVFSYKLRYIVGFRLVEIAISTNQKPTIYRNLYENTGPGFIFKLEI